MVAEVDKSVARELARRSILGMVEVEPISPFLLWDVRNFRHVSADALFSEEPLLIVDVQGRPLFFEFASLLPSGYEIRVTMSANQALGDPVVKMAIREKPLPFGDWMAKASRVLGIREQDTAIIVCHAYPRYGLLVPGRVPRIYDFMGRVVLELGPDTRALTWSPLDQIREPEAGLDSWKLSADDLMQESWRSGVDLEIRANKLKSQVRRGGVVLGLESQLNNWNCSPATATMILRFHEFQVNQRALAVDMRTRTNGSPVDLGTAPAAELATYRSTVGNGFTVEPDSSPTFHKVIAEILEFPDQGRPIKDSSSVDGAKHARAIAGWKIARGQKIFVYDPLPVWDGVNGGDCYWELWSKWPHSDFVFVRPV